MNDILVLQFNMNKLDIDTVRDKYMELRNCILDTNNPPEAFIAIPDTMSLMTCSLDELKNVRDGIDKIIGDVQQEEEELRKWSSKAPTTEIPPIVVAKFMVAIERKVLERGGSQTECNLITPRMAMNAIRRGRDPDDVAWAVMQ